MDDAGNEEEPWPPWSLIKATAILIGIAIFVGVYLTPERCTALTVVDSGGARETYYSESNSVSTVRYRELFGDVTVTRYVGPEAREVVITIRDARSWVCVE